MPGKGWMGSAAAAALMLALLGSGCAKKPVTPAAGGTTPATTTGSGSGYGDGRYGDGYGTPSSPSTSSGGGKGTTLQQGAGDLLVFAPTTLSVKRGATITVSNVSTGISHTFTITGKGIDITNSPGQSQQVSIDLPLGTYPFVCRFHESSGMTGTLTVTG